MRVLWLSHMVPYPPKGGGLQRAYHLLLRVAKVHEVHLISFVQRDLMRIHFDDLSHGLEVANRNLDFCKSVSFIDIPVDQIPHGKIGLAAFSLFSKSTYTINWLHSRKYKKSIRAILATTEIDLVHFDTISLGSYLSLVGDLPACLNHHNVESQMLERRSSKETSKIKKLYFAQEARRLASFEASICAKYAMNFVCSELDRDRLSAVCPEAVTEVVPNGVDTEYFKPWGGPANGRKLIFVGRLNAYSNAEAVKFIVSPLWPLLKERIPGVSMSIIGANPPKEAVQLASRDQSFEVFGYVQDVRDNINDADLYVCPIFDGGGTKLKILDAMAMQKTIVATRIACEGIDLVDNESVVFAETPEQFAESIEALLTDQESARRIAEASRQIAEEKYSFDSIGERLATIYDDVRKKAN